MENIEEELEKYRNLRNDLNDKILTLNAEATKYQAKIDELELKKKGVNLDDIKDKFIQFDTNDNSIIFGKVIKLSGRHFRSGISSICINLENTYEFSKSNDYMYFYDDSNEEIDSNKIDTLKIYNNMDEYIKEVNTYLDKYRPMK